MPNKDRITSYLGEKTKLVLLVGAGGHAQVVAEIVLRMREAGVALVPIGFLDDDPKLAGKAFLELPVLGALPDRASISHDLLIVALGDNRTRMQVFQSIKQEGERFAVAKHPRAIVAPDVKLGEGSMVCAGAVVNTQAIVGANVILNTGCTVDHHNQIGDHVHIAPGVHLGGDVNIGEGTLIGIGATVMPGKQVGRWSIVGAGAVVTDDVPERVVVVGMPARIIRKL